MTLDRGENMTMAAATLNRVATTMTLKLA